MLRPRSRSKHGLRPLSLVAFLGLTCLIALLHGLSHLPQPAARAAATFNVNSAGDGADSNTGDGVCDDGTGHCTLRAAVQQANQLAGDDVINVSVGGTISLSSALPNLSSLIITGPGSTQLTVRRDPGAAAAFRVFRTALSSTVSISGLTVSGGRADDDGGGIYNSQLSALSLSDVSVTNNATASFSTSGRGGGIYSDGASLTLLNCTVSDNAAQSGSFGGTSSGRDGGGVYVNRGTLSVTNSTVSGNRAGDPAGPGISGRGGGLFIAGGTATTLTNSTLSGNRAGLGASSGGGIFTATGNVSLNSCTVTDNTAGARAGGISGTGVSIRNTIVAGNHAPAGPDLSGTFNSQDFNLIGNTSEATFGGTTTHNLTGVNPQLSPLQTNEGKTRAHSLLPGSPAIDAGDSGGLTTDQRGLTRPVDNASAANASDGADIGSFEAQAPTPAGQLQFSSAAYSAAEGAGTAAVVVTRTGGNAGVVSATLSTSNQTAAAGEDYTAITGLKVEFADGDDAPKTVQVSVTDDALNEPDETLQLSLSNPAGGVALGTPAVATLTVSDNNDPLPSLSVDDITAPEGDFGETLATFTVTLSAPSGHRVTVEYATSEGTAAFNLDFSRDSRTLTFEPGQVSKTVAIFIRGDRPVEPDETFFLNLSNPTNAAISDAQGRATIIDDDSAPPGIRFVAAEHSQTEDTSFISVEVTRTGDTSQEASADYATSDVTASERSDYTTAVGRLRFAPGQTNSQFINVLLTDDRFDEAGETFNLTLSNATGATLGAGSTATVTITDNDAANGPSPVAWGTNFSTPFFVRQHYYDFLNREPDAPGLQFWTDEIEQCGANEGCREVRRINVSAAFFLSIEFQETGYLAYRARKAAFGNLPGKPVPITRLEMLRDMQVVGAGLVVGAQGWEERLERNKVAYFDRLASSARFAAAYPQALTPEQFVDALNANAGASLSPAQRDALAAALSNNSLTRAQAVRAVAEDADLNAAERNRAFVLMQYFGYLRRDPDEAPDADFAGFNFWLGKLDEFRGDFIQAEMVKAFLTADEYRQRFGQ